MHREHNTFLLWRLQGQVTGRSGFGASGWWGHGHESRRDLGWHGFISWLHFMEEGAQHKIGTMELGWFFCLYSLVKPCDSQACLLLVMEARILLKPLHAWTFTQLGWHNHGVDRGCDGWPIPTGLSENGVNNGKQVSVYHSKNSSGEHVFLHDFTSSNMINWSVDSTLRSEPEAPLPSCCMWRHSWRTKRCLGRPPLLLHLSLSEVWQRSFDCWIYEVYYLLIFVKKKHCGPPSWNNEAMSQQT